MISSFINKRFIYNILSFHPVFFFSRFINRKLSIGYYHMIGSDDKPHVKNLYDFKDEKAFIDDIDFLLKYYTPISLFDLISHIENQAPLANRPFLLTFDDGFKEMEEIVAPILYKKGVPATFFINSAFIDNNDFCYFHKASLLVEELKTKKLLGKNDSIKNFLRQNEIHPDSIFSFLLSIPYNKKHLLDDIAKLVEFDFNSFLKNEKPYLTYYQITNLINNGFSIGAHSIDHPFYATIPLDDQLFQTIESIKVIREKFNLSYGAFAFPHSDQKVSMDFFYKLFDTGLVNITFGTGGMFKDSFNRNFQRYSLENPKIHAKKIIAYQTARYISKIILKKDTIFRF